MFTDSRNNEINIIRRGSVINIDIMLTNVLVRLAVICCLCGVLLAVPSAKEQCETKVTNCLSSEEATKPVCGRNNQTYLSRCHLFQDQCKGVQVTMKHEGPCTGKSNTRRRSMGGGKKKVCSRADRIEFTKNLLEIFLKEHDRSYGSSADDLTVLEWKFFAIDTDNNDLLDEPEYSKLRRLLRKVVQPTRCARNFGRICDADRDKVISKIEWTTCFARNRYNLNPDIRTHGKSKGLFRLHRHGQIRTKPALLLQGSQNQVSHFGSLSDPVGGSKDEPDSNDCISDRMAVLDEQKNGDSVLYVPECTADGRYQNVQCYRSTGYCWCVYQDSGKPIPGTSIKNQNPKCETPSTSHRPMKGCPELKKKKFLKDLMEFLNTEMIRGTNRTGMAGSLGTSKWPASKEEQIATWCFVILDKNKNKILERKEWKPFRVLVSENDLLKRCGKKLPRYCDINHDRKINITEWLTCLEANSVTTSSSSTSGITNTSPSSKRKGPNPLESYLKGD